MAVKNRLTGGRGAMDELRSSGPMPVGDLLALIKSRCGPRLPDTEFRARNTYSVLKERGAFVERDGMAYPEYTGAYATLIGAMSDRKMTIEDISVASGLSKGEVLAILRDLYRSKEVIRLPKSKGKIRWALASAVPDGYAGARNSTAMYEDRIMDMCAEKSMTSEEIAEEIDESLPVTRGYLRCLSAKGSLEWAMPAPNSFKLWFSSEQARQDAYRRIDEIRSEPGLIRKCVQSKKEGKKARAAAPRSADRDPDRMERDLMAEKILSTMGERTLSEAELVAELGRSKSIKIILMGMWKEELLDRVYVDGTWKWRISSAAPVSDEEGGSAA